jgi:hypothetical protein
MAAAMRAVSASTWARSGPSIVTRASGSVPEKRTRTSFGGSLDYVIAVLPRITAEPLAKRFPVGLKNVEPPPYPF